MGRTSSTTAGGSGYGAMDKTPISDEELEGVKFDDAGPSPGYDDDSSVSASSILTASWPPSTSQSTAAVGESVGLSAPAMQRYSDEDLKDCPVEACVTAQWDMGVPEAGSFDNSAMGTHFFQLEPVNFDGEPGMATIDVKKYASSASSVEVVATCEDLTIVTILDEAIGVRSEWCKIRIADIGRSTDYHNVEGYVKRNTLRRLEAGDHCWAGPTTLPSPAYVSHRHGIKPQWKLGASWYTMLACEPWLDEKELRYKTMVNTGHKNRHVMDMLEDSAKRIGIKQLLVYYDRLPDGYDVNTIDNAVAYLHDNLYQFAKLEKTYLSDQPDVDVKALVSVNLSHLLALPRMVRSFTTASEVRTGYRTVMYQSDTFEAKIAKICQTMDSLQPHVDMFQGVIRGSQPYSPSKWAAELRKFPSSLKKLLKANNTTLRKDHEDIIEIATDGDFNPTHVIVYPDDTGIGMPQTIGFNNFASQAPVDSSRLMHYILNGNNMFSDAKLPEMSSLTPPWRKYLTNYTYPPLEIRPTPPSGLGKLPDLPNVANKFNKLNIKGPGDLAFEKLKLSDPDFLTGMANARFDAVTISGDNILGNLPIVLDKINSLDDVYAELLQKISIPKLIEMAMAKLMSELGLDNIYAALLEAALGQFSVDALINQFMLQLPEDLLSDLLEQLMDMVDLSCDDLIELIAGFGITTTHLSAIADQVAGEVDALREHVDAFNSVVGGLSPCGSDLAVEADTSLDEDLQEQAASVENALEDILANLTCDDLKLVVKNIATMGIPSFDFEPPTIDLSCFVKDIELMMGTVLMPFLTPLAGFPLDITRLGEIDWGSLNPGLSAPNINIRTPDGVHINISDVADFGLLPVDMGFSIPEGGFNPAIAAPNLNFPQFALGGIDASTGDIGASPGGLQFPNVKFSEAFSDIEFPGGVETLVETIGGLATGALPGISLESLGPGGDASLSDLSDVTFPELLDDWRRVFAEVFSGFLLSNFPLAMASGGGAFDSLKTKLSDYSWGTEGASMDMPDSDEVPIPNSSVPNIPKWDPNAVQVPDGTCTLSADVTETTGVGWQTLATMPREWWQASLDGSGVETVVQLPDFQTLYMTVQAQAALAGEEVEETKQALEALASFDFGRGFNPCELYELIVALVESLETEFSFNPVAGEFTLGADYAINMADITIPTAVFRPAVGCGTFQLYGIPDFGLGGMSLPLPIAGPNGDETFDILDLDEILRKLPDIPNIPNFMENIPSVPDLPAPIDLSVLCDKPDLFNFLTDVFTGDVPDVTAALGQFDGIIKSLTSLSAGEAGTAPNINAKKVMISLFKLIIEKSGFGEMISQLVSVLTDAMDAGTLTVEMIQEMPPIQAKIDMLMTSMPDMPTISPPSLGGFGAGGGGFQGGAIGGGMGGIGGGLGGSGGGAPALEAAPSQFPGAGMPSGAPGGASTTGGGIASLGAKFTIPTITLPDNIPTGDLMGSMFSGMQDSVKGAIESAIVEAGKSVLRTLLDSASDGDFGDVDIMDLMNNALGAVGAANALCEIFTNAGIDCDGNFTETTTSQTFTSTTVEIQMGCGEPYVIPPEEEPCSPLVFMEKCSQAMTTSECQQFLEGMVGNGLCTKWQDIMVGNCPHYALVLDDCQKIADIGAAIGAVIPDEVIETLGPTIQPLRDLKAICCAEPIRNRIDDLMKSGMSEDDAAETAAEEVAAKVGQLTAMVDAKINLPEGWPFKGDGHGDTVVPSVYDECLDSCPEPPAAEGLAPAKKSSLFPPDNEIPTLHFMNEMATDLMYEPTKLAFMMEANTFPEMLISGTVENVPIPFWEAAGTHASDGAAGISRFAEQLYNGGAVLCKSDGSQWGEGSYANKLALVRALLASAEADPRDDDNWDSDFYDIHVLQQQNSGAVAPVLFKSLQNFDYVSNEWDTESQTYAWYFQYGGDAESPMDEWPTVTWQMNPVSMAKLSASIETGQDMVDSATTSVPSTQETVLGEPCGEAAVTVEEAMAQADATTLEEGLPLKYQLFRQFIQEKFTNHPNLREGVEVTSLANWSDLGLDDKGTGVYGYKRIYQDVINQIIQSAGIQLTFTDLFSADTLRLVQIEPMESWTSQLTPCGNKPKSVLDLEESGKKPSKDAFMKACKDPAKEAESGKNAFKQAGLVGAINVTVRVYIIDHMVRSVFPMSEYDLIDFSSVFAQQIADKMNDEMNTLDPQYHAAFMEETASLFKSMCEAAQCSGEPLVDPLTGEEIEGGILGACDDVDPLMYFIHKHLADVASILDEKFGSSAPNMAKQSQEKWLTTLPLPEYPMPPEMSVSGMMTQADLYATLMNNPRPEIVTDDFVAYYDSSPTVEDTTSGTGDEGESEPPTPVYTAYDGFSTVGAAQASELVPDNIALPRLFTFSKTQYSSEDLDYVGQTVTIASDGTTDPEEEGEGSTPTETPTQTLEPYWDVVSDPLVSFLEENPYNNLYYSLVDNWQSPSAAEPSEFAASTNVKGGLYLEKFIKIGDEYWNADNMQEFFDRLVESASTGDATSIAALAAYAIQEAHYGLRLCYMYPSNSIADNAQLVAMLTDMFGACYGVTPDIAKMQGSFLQLEGVNFDKEVNTTIQIAASTDTTSTDSETSTDEESEEPETVEVGSNAIVSEQHQFYTFSIPLAETTISAGTAITGILSEMASLDELGTAVDWVTNYLEDGSLPEWEDFEAFETPWTNASAALDENMRDLRKNLRAEEDWKFIFKQCLFANEIVQNLWNYCAMMTSLSVPGIDGAFGETKQELRKLFWVLYHDIGTGGDGFSYVPESTSMELAITTTDSSPSSPPLPVKMALQTIPLLFKGIAEAIDPNIMIAKLIRTAADGDQGKIPKFASTLMALPFNLIPPPPFGPGIGPPITPIGLAYLALGAMTPAEKEKKRMSQVANPPPSPDDTGTDADCNPDEGEAD